MKAVVYSAGGPEGMQIGSAAVPNVQAHEILIKVYATAINRADCIQRRGNYPPPPGASEILGLEVSGIVERVGQDVTKWQIGDRVMALLSGGGYAEYAAAHENHVMRIPHNMNFIEAAAIPEAWLTAYQLLHFVGHVKASDRVLVHAAASGVGTAVVQMAKLVGATVYGTAGSHDKQALVTKLGASHCHDYHNTSFPQELMQATNGQGVTLILDCVGASMWQHNVASIGLDARWVVYGTMGGAAVSGDALSQILRKRITLTGTTLRTRCDEYKTSLIEAFNRDILPAIASHQLQLIIDTVLPLDMAAQGHQMMEANQNKGKIVLLVHQD